MTTTFVTYPYVVGSGEGLQAPLAALAAAHKVPAYVTEGRIAVLEHQLPARHLAAPLHRHSREDELSIVLEGTLGILLGDDVIVAGQGSYVYKPRGQWHAFWNAGDSPLRSIELLIPGGADAYFQQVSTLLAAGSAIDRAAIRRLGLEYGIEFDAGSVARLTERFDLIFPEAV